MADAQRTIDIVFNGVDKTGAAVLSALNNTRDFSGKIQSSTQPFADAATAALKYEAALIATGAAITAFSVKAASDFDSGFREVASLLDEPIEALGNFRQEILEYGSSSTASLAEVNGAVYSAISAGVDYTRSLDAVAQAEQLAIAGKGDLNDTLTLLVSSLNAYGLSTEEAARFSDSLFTTVRLGQTTLPELNSSLQAVTGTAATLGVDFEEVLAALAALTSAGTPTAQAVTQIQAVLTALIKPSTDAAKLSKELGINFGAQAIEAEGLQGVLASVAAATGGNQEQMARLFGSVEAVRAVLPLTGIAADTFANNIVELGNSAGATEEAYNKLAESLDNVAARLSASFESLGVAIGGPLLDEAGSVASAISEIFSALGSSFSEGDLRQITQFIESEFAGLAETLSGVARALPEALGQADLTGFTDGLSAVREAIVSLFGGLDLTNVNDLARAIEFVGNAFDGLSQFSAGIIESFGPLLRRFAELAESASQSEGALRDLGNVFGVATQINKFAGAIGGVAGSLEVLLDILIARQGIGLVAAIGGAGGLSAGIATLGGALATATPFIAAAASAFAGLDAALKFARGEDADNFINSLPNLFGFDDFSDQIGDSLDPVFRLVDQVIDKFAEADEAIAAPDPQPFTEFAGDLSKSYFEVQKSILGVQDAVDDDSSILGFANLLQESADAAEGVSQELDTTAVSAKNSFSQFETATDGAADSIERLGADGQRLTGTFSVIESGAKKAVTSIEDLADASDQIRADVFIAQIESATAVSVANIEADAQRITSAFDAVSLSFENTGDALGDLYGALTDPNLSRFDKYDIQSELQRESDRRDQLLKRQLALTDAEIKVANARARRFNSGDALIKVDGAGLQPHLEAFMFEILESIQVRVNADGYNLLLGAGA